jgi:hypothetical protein
MKTLVKSVLAGFVAVTLLAVAVPALAVSPTLSVNREGSGDNYRLTVYGDAYGYINKLAYRPVTSSLWTDITGLGQLDGSGYYSTVLTFQGSNNVEMYVTVNGQQTSVVQVNQGSGCTYNCGNGNISFSQSNVSLTQNQSMYVSVYNNTYYGNNSYYVSSNSNSGVVSVSLSGNQLYLTGLSNGSSTITVCQYSGNCGYVYVTVSGYQNSSFTLSPSSVIVNQGQSSVVYAYVNNNNNNNYNYNNNGYVYSNGNTNSSVAYATISGNTITVYGSNPGSATMTFCHSQASQCQSLFVTVQSTQINSNLYFTTQHTAPGDRRDLAVYLHFAVWQSSCWFNFIKQRTNFWYSSVQ